MGQSSIFIIKNIIRVGYSDPATLCGQFAAQQIKGTLGITG